ncbi:sensor histidine kinase [Exiguobacterium sp. RIT594]|uniref:sensor histidine kinase n=1 Tax=Exiguobacterium sp. RIT594 TaxID=2282449 RepID=UPI000DF72F43|nr:sensor histidine kinase [Exiguobacterium sp. RIT594]RDB32684.1 HAMP domain-containing protein [Exiguobacterium sp. RIT594]
MKSIRTRLIRLVVLAILIPTTLATSASYLYVRNQNVEQAERSSLSALKRGSNQISHYMEDVRRLPTSLYANRSLLNIMNVGADAELSESEGVISRALLGLFLSRQDIEQLHFVILKGNSEYSVYNMKTSSRGKFDWLQETDYFRLMKQKNGWLIDPAHQITAYNTHTMILDDKQIVSFRYRINRVETDEPLGFLSVDIPTSVFEQQLKLFENFPGESLWLLNGNQLIAKTGKELPVTNDRFTGKSGSMRVGDSFIVYAKTITQGVPITLVKTTPYASVVKGANETALILILIGIGSLVLMIIAASLVALEITKPIKQLTANVWRVEQGDLSAQFIATTNDEIGLLNRQFQRMIQRIDRLIKREYRLALENRTNELRALQSQLNPHFLFNALQSIGTTTLQGDRKIAYRSITGLSQMMRYSMNNEQTIVTLKQEVDHLQSYMRLQQQRFPDRFRYIVDVPWHMNSIEVPKMILQPFAENYFKHAFNQQVDATENYLAYKVRSDGDQLIIQVENSGAVMESTELKSIDQTMRMHRRPEDRQTSGIGLHNIYERLLIFYGEEASMILQSPTEGGFRIVIRIPVEQEEL